MPNPIQFEYPEFPEKGLEEEGVLDILAPFKQKALDYAKQSGLPEAAATGLDMILPDGPDLMSIATILSSPIRNIRLPKDIKKEPNIKLPPVKEEDHVGKIDREMKKLFKEEKQKQDTLKQLEEELSNYKPVEQPDFTDIVLEREKKPRANMSAFTKKFRSQIRVDDPEAPVDNMYEQFLEELKPSKKKNEFDRMAEKAEKARNDFLQKRKQESK
jgi:hypothetical protein